MKNQLFAFLLAAIVPGSAAVSGEVTLKSHDGSMSMTGDLVSYDGQSYVIKSAIGEVSVDAFRVDCIGADCPQSAAGLTNFTISGSKTIGAVLMPSLIEAFAFDQNATPVRNVGAQGDISLTLTPDGETTGSVVTILTPGSSGGVEDLRTHNADFAVLSRPMDPAEIVAIGGVGRQAILALDALVPIVSADNPLRSISEQDLASIFSGGVVNWSDLGGNDAPIKMYMRETGSGTRTAFDQIVMDAFIAELADEATILTKDEDIADAVAADPNAIGIVSLAAARNARILPILGICGIETAATSFTIKTEEYPLSRRIFMVSPSGSLAAGAESFLQYLQSDAAQFEIADAGFVDQLIEPTPIGIQGARFATAMMPGLADTTLEHLQNMMSNLMLAQRLTVTFRFIGDPVDLDDRARADVLRLAKLLENGAFDGKEIILAGFTDSDGSMSKNRELSTARSTQIRDAILAALPAGMRDKTKLTVIGYGETSPLACNEIASGRAVNRRVEVWVK